MPGGRHASFRDEAENGGAGSRPRPSLAVGANGPGIHQPPRLLAPCLRRGTFYDPGRMSLFARLVSFSNLLLAYRKASRGKRGSAAVADFEHRLEDHLLRLQRELIDGSYRPGAYASFFIHEPKRRLISAAPFRDRVVHHALCNLIEPIFERSFTADSFANRRGKGTHAALDRCQQLSRRFRYVLQADVQQFFPSIDHEVLLRLIEKKIGEERVLALVRTILDGGRSVLCEQYRMVYFPGDDLLAVNRPRGLPIGNLTSQFWANVYLSPVDHCVKRELGCRGYVRYVDDLLLFADDKATLWRWSEALRSRLERFRLTLHPGLHPRPVSEGIPFLGFVSYPDRRRIKGRKVVHWRRRLRGKLATCRGDVAQQTRLRASLQGWLNHAGFGTTAALRRSIAEEVSAVSAAPPPAAAGSA